MALEAGNLSFIMAREIMECVGSEVRVLNAAKLPFIGDAPMKTDKEDGAVKREKVNSPFDNYHRRHFCATLCREAH